MLYNRLFMPTCIIVSGSPASLLYSDIHVKSLLYRNTHARLQNAFITVRKRIRIPCGILIKDGDRSVTLQTNTAYFSSQSAFKLKNYVPMNKIELPLHPETHK